MNRANIFMSAGWAGLAGCAVVVAGSIHGMPDLTAKLGALLTLAASWTLVFTRNADEYTRGLWNAASSLAFASLLILFIALPFAEGFYDGVRESLEDRTIDHYSQDISSEVSISLAILAFYIGLFWKRFKGDA